MPKWATGALAGSVMAAGTLLPTSNVEAAPKKHSEGNNEKPNIIVIWGDDVGMTNISAYSRGLMGYKTPNIDRIADEGALFTDYYAEQSCTAGRSSFVTGQIPFRVGLSKVGLPGAKQGISF